MKIIACALLSVVAHLLFGWIASLTGSLLAGWWHLKKGWLAGSTVLSLSWSVLLAWTFIVAGHESLEWARILSGLLGNMPTFVGVALSILIASILGGCSGFVGQSIARLKTKAG